MDCITSHMKPNTHTQEQFNKVNLTTGMFLGSGQTTGVRRTDRAPHTVTL